MLFIKNDFGYGLCYPVHKSGLLGDLIIYNSQEHWVE